MSKQLLVLNKINTISHNNLDNTSQLSNMQKDHSSNPNMTEVSDNNKLDLLKLKHDSTIHSKANTSDEAHFSFFDDDESFSFFDDSEKIKSNYECFDENLYFRQSDLQPITLMRSNIQDNSSLMSTRFVNDMIFTINDSKILECASAGLALAVVSAMLFLPDGFDVSATLMLSAPLFACVCGIFAKRYKRHKSKLDHF